MRCKMKLESIRRRKHWDKTKGDIQDLEFTAVMNGSEENKSFFAATPSGSLIVGTVNAEAVAALELGESYYVDITPAPK